MIKKTILSVVIIVSVLSPSFAAAFKLPDTGQTKCYQADSPYAEIPCYGTGQDGQYTINTLSYTDNGNGTGGADLSRRADGGLTEEDAEGPARRPVPQLTQLQDVAGMRLEVAGDGDAEIDLFAPGQHGGCDRKRRPDRRGRAGELRPQASTVEDPSADQDPSRWFICG